MSDHRVSRTADEIETILESTLAQMNDHQKKGNYIDAENCRLLSEQLKKDLENRRLHEMEQRQKKENSDL